MSENSQENKVTIRPVSKGAWFRIVFLALALVNQVLVVYGKSPLPITQDELKELVTAVWTGVAALYAWWKDNDWTVKARSRVK
ncbi:Phage lysis protein, holin [Bacillus sp. THAF10]|uniref:phage holin n=1 Tax=Bacillus sp. THAF10 TaxID=2587848 RepID=UPI0012A9C0A6|nr:phage holin [Bacillus sp. THAF10]QFT88970.1 Phage lysis protein, holin [Bacillus sp. THAF10]